MTKIIQVENQWSIVVIEQWMRFVSRNKHLRRKYGALYLKRFYQMARSRHLSELGEAYGHIILKGVLPEVTRTHHKHAVKEVCEALSEHQALSRRSFCSQREACILAHMGACPLINKATLAEGDVVSIKCLSSHHVECEIACIMGFDRPMRLRAYPIGRANHRPFPFPTLPGEHVNETYRGVKYSSLLYTRAEFQAYLGVGVGVSPAKLAALTLVGTPNDNALGFLVGSLRFSVQKKAFLRPFMDCDTAQFTATIFPALMYVSNKQPIRAGFASMYAVSGTSTLQYICLTSGLLMRLGIEVHAPEIIRYGAEQVLRVFDSMDSDRRMWRIRLMLAATSKRSMVGFCDVDELARKFNLNACTDVVEGLITAGLPVLVVSLVLELSGLGSSPYSTRFHF